MEQSCPEPGVLFQLGRTLEPLRREGVLIVGSGFLSHNLRALDLRPDAPTPAWAAEFDAWSADVVTRRDVDALLDYRHRAPAVRLALPTHEHFAPVVVAAGAALGGNGAEPRVSFPITGFMGGSLTRRSIQWTPSPPTVQTGRGGADRLRGGSRGRCRCAGSCS